MRRLFERLLGPSQREQDRAAWAEAMKAVTDASIKQAEATVAQAQALTAFLESFKVNDPPTKRLNADATAWFDDTVAEMEAKGLPVGATELDRLRWIEQQIDLTL